MSKLCIVCNKEINRKNKRFCGTVCMGKWMSKNRIGNKSSHWKGGDIEKKCKKCGSVFLTRRSTARVECCSIRCSKLGHIPWNKKENRKDIIQQKRDRSSENYRNWRMEVYKKNSFSCVHCGIHCDRKQIVAHHVYYFSYFPELRFTINNGITLCRSCHLTLHNKNKGVDKFLFEHIKEKNYQFII